MRPPSAGYVLGVDMGTTFTAAAVRRGERTDVVQLGSQRPEVSSTVFLTVDGEILVGEAAERRGRADPTRLAREFKRRIGDPTPILLGGVGYAAPTLMSLLLQGVLQTVVEQQEGPPSAVGLTCPASWGTHRRGVLAAAVAEAGVERVEYLAEPEAAAVWFASSDRVSPGELLGVYDFGGGTFDAAVVRRTADGFEPVGKSLGLGQLGGVDFDQLVVEHVLAVLGGALDDADPQDPAVVAGLVRLRRDCVEAKEALSFDIDVAIPVALPGVHTQVRLTRSEFEALIAPSVAETVALMGAALASADVDGPSLRSIVLAGGSSRIPLISEQLAARFGCPLVHDATPEHTMAIGAALATPRIRSGHAGSLPDFFPPGASRESPSGIAAMAVEEPPSAAGPGSDPEPTTTARSAPGGRRTKTLVALAVALCLIVVSGVVIWQVVRPGSGSDENAGPTPASWVRRADLPVALEGAAVTAYQSRVWVAGGLSTDEARTKLSTVFVYDPDSDSWTTGPSLPRPVSHGSLVATTNGLYFLGGWLADGYGSAAVFRLNATNTAWVPDVPLPATRVAGAAAFDGRWLIYAGGTAKGGVAADDVWALQGARWVPIGHLATRRQKLAAVGNAVDTVWLLGGRDQQSGQKFGTVDRVYQGKVVAGSSSPVSPAVDSAAAVRLEGIGICLVGGEIAGRRYNDWWCDRPGAAAALPRLVPQRAGLGLARIGQTVYVVGGYGDGFQGTKAVEAFTAAPG